MDGLPISPFLTRLASESKIYGNYVASANWTIPSYASMFTGLPTVAHNFWGMKRFPGQPVELIFDEIARAGLKPSLLCIGVLAESDIFKYRTEKYFATNYDPLKLDGTIDLVVKTLEDSDFVFFHTFLMHDYFYHYPYRSPDLGLKRRYEFVDRQQTDLMSSKMKAWLREHFEMNRGDLRILERMYYNECLLVDDFCQKLLGAVLERFPDISLVINSDHGEVYLYDRSRDFAFILAEDLYSTSAIEPTESAVAAYRHILKARARDLPAYDQAQEAVLLRLQGFGYL